MLVPVLLDLLLSDLDKRQTPPQQVTDDTRQGAVANTPECSLDRMERWPEKSCLKFTKGKIKQGGKE